LYSLGPEFELWTSDWLSQHLAVFFSMSKIMLREYLK